MPTAPIVFGPSDRIWMTRVSDDKQGFTDRSVDPGSTEPGENRSPDLGFTLADGVEGTVVDPSEPQQVPGPSDPNGIRLDPSLTQIVTELRTTAPGGWQRLEALFVATVTDCVGRLVYSSPDGIARREPSERVVELVREQRAATAEQGPWFRLLLSATAGGGARVDYDYGKEPFPEGQLLPPEAYRADLEAYPRERLPVWLAAYMAHGDRQSRSPHEAAVSARADRAAGLHARRTADEFAPLPILWARWAVLSAAFVAAGSDRGPRIMPSVGWFESARRSGSTLVVLPDDRAVLSGGTWEAPALDAAYNSGAELPRLYTGAPEWVADPVLNPRALTGLLSFCYWWDRGAWHCAQSPPAAECDRAVPGVWTADTVTGIIIGLIERPGEEPWDAVADLVAAAEIGVVTTESVRAVFDGTGDYDLDGALYQLTVAGVMSTVPEPLAESEAVEQVHRYIVTQGFDTSGYPLTDLIADRVSCGWMVHVPVPAGRVAVGRAIFYVADDGVLEHSSSSVAPSLYVAGFERRYRKRQSA